MEVLSKNEILESISRHYSLTQFLTLHPKHKLGVHLFFSNYGREEAKRDLLINNIMLLIRGISYETDRNYKSLDEDQITIDLDHIFLTEAESKVHPKRQIIGLIRNSLCHGEYTIVTDNNELYVEIYNEKIKPVPFYVKLSIKDLENIFYELFIFNGSTKQAHIQTKQFENIEDTKDEIMKQFHLVYWNNIDTNNCKNIPSTLEEIKKDKNTEVKEIELTEDQREEVNFRLQKYKKAIGDKKEKEAVGLALANFEYYLIREVIPDGMLKTNNVLNSLLVNHLILSNNFDLSYNDIVSLNQDIIKPIENRRLAEIITKNLIFYYSYKNEKIINEMNFTILLTYLIENHFDVTHIRSNGKKINKGKIRNSLVHGRWYYKKSTEEMVFFDYENEYDYNFHEIVNLSSLYNFISGKHDLDNIKQKQKKNS